VEQRRLSKGNKLYVKRILKQNKEYRQMQRMKQTSSLSVEDEDNIHSKINKRGLNGKNVLEEHQHLHSTIGKQSTKTYQKYLNAVSNTLNFRNFKNKNRSKVK